MVTKRRAPHAKHTHRYIKIGGKYTPLWKCADGDCRHFVYLAQENVIVGRFSLCWECGLKFIMDEDAMKEDQPRCHECRRNEIPEIYRDKLKKTESVDPTEDLPDKIEVFDPEE